MLPEFRKKLLPAELNWIIINNLEKFNDKPALIEDLYKKLQVLHEHPILGMFATYYEEIYDNYFSTHNTFPDMAWLEANFKKSSPLKILDDPFSMSIYEDLMKTIDREVLRLEVETNFLSKENPTMDDIRNLSAKMVQFTDNGTEIPLVMKEDIINMYDEYIKTYKGVKTYIEPLDNIIGNLGYKSISVFGAPSGHGKSTFALSVTYNAAVYGGLCVDYLSYELDKEQMWFNLVSLESSIQGKNIKASDIKQAMLSEEEALIYRECSASLLAKLNVSGGFINVIDQSAIQIATFEGLTAKLESIAEERKRKADLIVVDNVDNLALLKSTERDDSTKVNNFIRGLDSFSKRYYNGEGTAVLLLTQLNRTGFRKLQENNDKSEESKSKIDVTVFQQFNALYEKATCALVGYSDEKMRTLGRMNIHSVKLRNRQVPIEPLKIPADFAYSRIGGDVMLQDTSIEDVEAMFAEQSDAEDIDTLCGECMD